MPAGVHPPRNRHAEELEGKGKPPAGGGVPPHHQRADLDVPHAPFDVGLDGEGVAGELLKRNVGQEPRRVHEDRVAAHRPLDGYADDTEVPAKALHPANPIDQDSAPFLSPFPLSRPPVLRTCHVRRLTVTNSERPFDDLFEGRWNIRLWT